MSEISTKPYLLRAMYEWCTDNGYTPYVAVKVQGQVRVPMEFVRNGDIVLNISFGATSGLKIDNEALSFKARFGGVSRDIYVPVGAIAAIYASENNQGMGFDVDVESTAEVSADEAKAEVLTAEKPAITLAVTNTENSALADNKNPKEIRKKPSLTIIK
ncbi:MAG: ClpXP protease specificity-enhancing factor [Solimicrobium sp.]|nr:ClpXP protease specificity-enhancing factor [Solimicrobium sp.]